MKNEIVGKVDEYIQALADTLGVAAEYVFEVLVRQQMVEGIINLTVAPVITVIFAALLIFSVKKTEKADWETEDTWAFMSILFGGITVASFIISIFTVSTGIGQLINPEYYAIKEILDVFKGGD